MKYKFLGILIITVAALMVFLIFQDDLSTRKNENTACTQLTPSEQLIKLIHNDFQSLTKSKQLPEEWNSIATTEVKLKSDLARIILGKARPSFLEKKEGKFHLEVEVVDLPDNENPGLIIQASLFDIRSKNKIFEIGRTYTMNDLNNVDHKTSSTRRIKTK